MTEKISSLETDDLITYWNKQPTQDNQKSIQYS